MPDLPVSMADVKLGSTAATRPIPRLLRDLVSLTKPRLSSLVLITAGGGLWLSGEAPTWTRAVATLVGTTMLVGGANALNCWIERDSDRHMARTRTRPLPAGRLDPRVALVFGVLLGALAIPLLALLTTPLAGMLAALAFVTYVCIYTPLKRRSSLSTLVGALPGALPPLIGWTAATGRLDAGGLVLFSILFLWQIPHSLAIAMYRKVEYAQAGLKVFPLDHGENATRQQILLYTLALAPAPLVLVHLGVAGTLTSLVSVALGAEFVRLAWQGWRAGGGARWARRIFVYSLLYLSTLFVVLAVDRWV